MGLRPHLPHDGCMDDETRTSPAGPSWMPNGMRGLRRSTSERKVAGVCGGIGAYLDIDPLVFRIVLAVLAVFGGVGVLLYGLAWLLVPDEGSAESEGERLVRGRADGSVVAAIVAVIVGLTIFSGFLGRGLDAGGLVLLTLVAVGLVVAVRHSAGPRPGVYTTAAASPPTPAGTGAFGQTPGTAYSSAPAATAAWTPGPPPPPYWRPPAPAHLGPPKPPKPPAERSFLSAITLSVACLVAGGLVAAHVAGQESVDITVVLAAVVMVTGAGLVVATRWGRAPSLIAVGAVATVLLVLTQPLDVPFAGGIGERDWQPTAASQLADPYRLGIGDAVLDLTRLPAGQQVTRVEASVGMGSLEVLLPDDVAVEIEGHAGLGNLHLPDGTDNGGADIEWNASYGPEMAAATLGPERTVVVDVNVGIGEVRISR
jgi:phage shock protein PspC (stress-responsive transcriptional regulator)